MIGIGLIALFVAPVLGYAIAVLRERRMANDRIAGKLYKIEAERDRYREIAESHEIKWTGWPEIGETVWKTPAKFGARRSYDGMMEANLAMLARDLVAEIGADTRIKLTAQPYVIGAWAAHLNARGWHRGDDRRPFSVVDWGTSRPATLTLVGYPADIMSALRIALQDPAWDLWENGAWAVPDGLCSIVVYDVTITQYREARIAVEIKIALTEAEARWRASGRWPTAAAVPPHEAPLGVSGCQVSPEQPEAPPVLPGSPTPADPTTDDNRR